MNKPSAYSRFCPVALLLALAGIANSLSRSIAEARSPIGIRFALGATAGELARNYLGTSVRDLALAGAAVCGLALVVKLAAPAFAAVLALWLVVPALRKSPRGTGL